MQAEVYIKVSWLAGSSKIILWGQKLWRLMYMSSCITCSVLINCVVTILGVFFRFSSSNSQLLLYWSQIHKLYLHRIVQYMRLITWCTFLWRKPCILLDWTYISSVKHNLFLRRCIYEICCCQIPYFSELIFLCLLANCVLFQKSAE
jgi:hypothetical protein